VDQGEAGDQEDHRQEEVGVEVDHRQEAVEVVLLVVVVVHLVVGVGLLRVVGVGEHQEEVGEGHREGEVQIRLEALTFNVNTKPQNRKAQGRIDTSNYLWGSLFQLFDFAPQFFFLLR
jgi:flagellar basal body-associated protein FliL